VSIPLDDNISSAQSEKKRNYQALCVELRDMWHVRDVEVIPVIISTNGLADTNFINVLKKLQLSCQHFQTMQKAVLLGTTSIVRNFLNIN
jgi:hypothetical protein